MDDFEKIRKLIGQAKLKKAIIELLKLDTTFNDLLLGLQSRLSALETKELSGIISHTDASLERNLINHSVVSTLSKMENKNPVNTNPVIEITDNDGLEKIIGRNGLKRIDWLTTGLKRAKSVCKIHTSDGYVGTGFLIEGGYVFTNNHVIGSASIAQFSKVEFGFDSLNDDSIFYEIDHHDFVTSKSLDYTRLKIKDDASKLLKHWGILKIIDTLPKQNDALVIIQHPQGRSKELAFSDGENSVWEHRLHYKVTTEPGSSGSPVFDVNWNVVALHHAGGNLKINTQGDVKYVNEGILFSYIQKDISLKEGKNILTSLGSKNVKSKKSIIKPIKVILIYNSQDNDYADGVYNHLYSQVRTGNIEIFDMQNDIPPQANKEEFLNTEIENAEIALVFISRNLYKRETRKIALKIENLVGVKTVIPIKVSPFDLNATPFQKLQGLPRNSQSIIDFDNLDEVLYEIGLAISGVIKNILN